MGVYVGSRVSVVVLVGVGAARVGVLVGGRGGTASWLPGCKATLALGRQLPIARFSAVVLYVSARLCKVSPDWTVMAIQPFGMGQFEAGEGNAVGAGVGDGAPGTSVGSFVGLGAWAICRLPSVIAMERPPRMIAAESSAARIPKITWRKLFIKLRLSAEY